MTEDLEALTLTCTACGVEYFTDARDAGAALLHLPSRAHRVIPADGVTTRESALRQARVEVLAIAVRLADIGDDLERVMALLDRADRPDPRDDWDRSAKAPRGR